MADRPCAACGGEIGNPVFTICDTCWDKRHGECNEPDTPVRVLKTDAEKLSWLRLGLTMVLDLPSDTSDLDILVAVATARSAEVSNDHDEWTCLCGNTVMGPQCTVCKAWRAETPP